LSEKESVVAKWESGSFKPRVDIARRIGKILKLKLTEKIEENDEIMESKKIKSEGFTLGDFIKKR
jgi:ribosome-binding protein aMBF1 (putative translation factor)